MHFVQAKGILSAQNGFNLYRGCTHGCIYCDSRSQCYQMNHLFEDIEVKRNAPELLEQALRRKRRPCMLATGSMTDPYLHAEEELKYTRRCLEIIRRYGFGVAVHTKSARILRDLDLLEEINRQSKCVVQMTITTMDEKLCAKIEPNVSTTRERLEVLRILRRHGIPTVVWLCPILPFLNDTEENIRGILDACADAGVYGVISFGMGLTLREGSREYFYKKLDELFPGLKEQYIQTYGNRYEVRSPHNERLMKLFYHLCDKYRMVSDVSDLFAYLKAFPEQSEQLSLF